MTGSVLGVSVEAVPERIAVGGVESAIIAACPWCDGGKKARAMNPPSLNVLVIKWVII